MARTVLIVVIVVEHARDAIVLLARTSWQPLAWQSAPSRRHIARRARARKHPSSACSRRPLFDADVSTGGRSFSMQKGGRMPMTIVVSADVQPQTQARVRQLGASGFVPKSVR